MSWICVLTDQTNPALIENYENYEIENYETTISVFLILAIKMQP